MFVPASSLLLSFSFVTAIFEWSFFLPKVIAAAIVSNWCYPDLKLTIHDSSCYLTNELIIISLQQSGCDVGLNDRDDGSFLKIIRNDQDSLRKWQSARGEGLNSPRILLGHKFRAYERHPSSFFRMIKMLIRIGIEEIHLLEGL